MTEIVKKAEMPAVADPFALLRQMLSWDPFRDGGYGGLPGLARAHLTQAMTPSFDVKESADGFTISADLPGVSEKDIEVTLSGNRLTVSGKREAEARREGERWHAIERTYGTFSRSFLLPDDIQADQVKADLANGVLVLKLPRKPECQPRQIKVKGA